MAMTERLAHARARMRSAVSALFVGGVVAGFAIISAVPASATDGAVARRCSSTHKQYSRDNWQYAEFSLCAEKAGTTISYRVKVTKLQYYWGSHWYYNKYRSAIKTSLIVHRDGRTIGSSVGRGATPGGTTVGANGAVHVPVPGLYRLIAQVDIDGVYWSSDSDSSVLSEPFSLELVVA